MRVLIASQPVRFEESEWEPGRANYLQDGRRHKTRPKWHGLDDLADDWARGLPQRLTWLGFRRKSFNTEIQIYACLNLVGHHKPNAAARPGTLLTVIEY